MRIYKITRSVSGIVRCMVRHINGGNPTLPPPYRLPHANLHSPTGFECGYGGSGPADLAASILADFFNVNARTVAAAYRGRPSRKPRPTDAEKVVHLHQDFKAGIISQIKLGNGQEHQLTGDEIAEWLARHESGTEVAGA